MLGTHQNLGGVTTVDRHRFHHQLTNLRVYGRKAGGCRIMCSCTHTHTHTHTHNEVFFHHCIYFSFSYFFIFLILLSMVSVTPRLKWTQWLAQKDMKPHCRTIWRTYLSYIFFPPAHVYWGTSLDSDHTGYCENRRTWTVCVILFSVIIVCNSVYISTFNYYV